MRTTADDGGVLGIVLFQLYGSVGGQVYTRLVCDWAPVVVLYCMVLQQIAPQVALFMHVWLHTSYH